MKYTEEEIEVAYLEFKSLKNHKKEDSAWIFHKALQMGDISPKNLQHLCAKHRNNERNRINALNSRKTVRKGTEIKNVTLGNYYIASDESIDYLINNIHHQKNGKIISYGKIIVPEPEKDLPQSPAPKLTPKITPKGVVIFPAKYHKYKYYDRIKKEYYKSINDIATKNKLPKTTAYEKIFPKLMINNSNIND